MAFNKESDRGDAPRRRMGGIRRRKKVCVFCGKDSEISYKDSVSAMYLRVSGEDAEAKVQTAFGEISTAWSDGELAVLTPELRYGEFQEICEALENDGIKILSSIRIGDI